jgi:MSHA biogenesis protein MshE
MGAPGYMVATSVHAVLAQRLVRVICESCAERYIPTPAEVSWVAGGVPGLDAGVRYMHGRGCSHCNGTGYAGRMGVYELLEMTEPLIDALGESDPAPFRLRAHQQMAGATLRDSALQLAAKGRTTLAEVMRLATQIED